VSLKFFASSGESDEARTAAYSRCFSSSVKRELLAVELPGPRPQASVKQRPKETAANAVFEAVLIFGLPV
jgi:hypothetical protein